MIHIVTTGGTIEGLATTEKEKIPVENTILIKGFFEIANVSFPYLIDKIFQKDSRSITDKDRKFLVEKIKSSSYDKILITHGTFTMEDTAEYLGQLKLNKTIVLVGSFRSGSSADSDAPFNLGYAICALQFLKPGVYVAINGKIFNWDNVTKNLKTNKFEQKNV